TLDAHADEFVSPAEARGHREFGLSKIPRAATDHARLVKVSGENVYGRADGIAIGLRALQFEADAVVVGQLLVAKQDGRAVVGGQQNVQIAVAIEVAVSQPAADTGLVEASARFGGHVAEFSVPFV